LQLIITHFPMKKTSLVTLLLIFSAYIGLAQGYKEGIKKRFGEFYTLIAAGKTEQSMEYIPDAFFTIIPKEQMVSMMKSVMNNKDLDYRILDYSITEVKDSTMINNNCYSILKYTSNMTMKFKNIDTIRAAGKRKETLNLLKISLGNSFGVDNVKLDEPTGTFSITSHKKSCAVLQNGQSEWKFINIEARQRVILEKIIPKEIIESL